MYDESREDEGDVAPDDEDEEEENDDEDGRVGEATESSLEEAK